MDTDTDRSQILANFQVCANIEDIDHALAVLEATNWDLTEAINMTLADDTGFSMDPSPLGVNGRGLDIPPPVFNIPPEAPLPRRTVHFNQNSNDVSINSLVRERMDDLGVNRRNITFHAQYLNELIEVQLLDSSTVDDVKDMLSAKINKDKSEFTLSWQDQRRVVEDNNTLRELNLPRENTLRIVLKSSDILETSASTSAQSDPVVLDRSLSEDLNRVYKLEIEVTTLTDNLVTKEYDEPGTKTVNEIKTAIENSYGIPIIQQNWNGWSSHVTDDMTLAYCQLSLPSHQLTVCKKGYNLSQGRPWPTPAPRASAAPGASMAPTQMSPTPMSDSESECNDYDMYDDSHDIDLALETPSLPANSRTPLIPASMTDDLEAVNHFNTEFANRYGGSNGAHPVFYNGRLKEAVDASLQCAASERRLLALYLHHDGSIAANVFCSQVLCSDAIVNYLTSNFVTWGWDLTSQVNMQRFLATYEQVMGRNATDFVRRLKTDELPVVIILAKIRGSLEILGASRATVSAEDMMTTLLQAEDVFQESRAHDIREERERKEREEVKALQDEAYEESLALDRKKQLEKEQEERLIKEQIDADKLEEETMEAIKQSVADTIPDEPPTDCAETMARLRFRCPDGQMLTRRFLGVTSLTTLFNYLVTQGYRTEEYKVLTTFPRKDLTQEDHKKSLEEVKLCPQETLILEAR